MRNRYERVMAMCRDGKTDEEILKRSDLDRTTLSVYRKVAEGRISEGRPLEQAETVWSFGLRKGNQGKVPEKKMDNYDAKRARAKRKIYSVGYDKMRALGVDLSQDPIFAWEDYQTKKREAHVLELKKKYRKDAKKLREARACRGPE